MMAKFYPRRSFFSFQGGQNVLFYLSQTVYSMFICDTQKVFSSLETELILHFALGTHTLFLGSPGRSESMFQLTCSHEKMEVTYFSIEFLVYQNIFSSAHCILFSLISFSPFSKVSRDIFSAEGISLYHSAHKNFFMFFYLYFATRKPSSPLPPPCTNTRLTTD